MLDIIDLGPEMFMDGEGLVISYKGENFYKACGEIVNRVPQGGTTSCVKRTNHPGRVHEDYYGNTKEHVDGAPAPTLAPGTGV